MPVYPCPECGAQLRPQNPVPAGKKLRCPKCETVFAPAAKAKAKAVAAPAVEAVAEPPPEGYGLAQEEVRSNEDAARAAFDPIKDRFKRSARGPALILIVKPSTMLLRNGCMICIMAIAGVLYSIWPMIFKIEDTKPPDKMAKFRGPEKNERHFKELTPEEYRDCWLMLGVSILQFGWGAVICAGASKMHSLEAYPLAVIASVMAFVGPFVPLGILGLIYSLDEANDSNWLRLPSCLGFVFPGVPICFWCLATLRNEKVLAGFREEKPDEV
jgi:hypothetical protein